MAPYITGGAFSLTATQYANTYLRTSSVQKKLSKVYGSSDVSAARALWAPDTHIFDAANICKYTLSSGTSIALDITINSFSNPLINGARLQIYGGKYGNDALLFDSLYYTGEYPGLVLTAPCGRATIILQANVTGSPVDYGLDYGYQISVGDTISGKACISYSKYSHVINAL